MKALVNGVVIDYRDEGSGIPVILIHAFPLNQMMWSDQVEALREYCRVITLDLRGFGNSGVPDGQYSMDQMASDIRELMRDLRIDRAVLVGLSMGGYISLAFYRNCHDAVYAMVLADTRARADTDDERMQRITRAEKVALEGVLVEADFMRANAFAHSKVGQLSDVIERMYTIVSKNSTRGLTHALHGMSERQDLTHMLSEIKCPVLILTGSDDELTPLSEARILHDGIPNSMFREIAGAGHFSNLEQPRQFNALLLEFIRSL